MDHSARVSRKSKANFVIYCELQNALIINLSNAHCGYWLTVAPFVWGSVVSSIVTFVSGGLWGVMVLMSCVESCVWRFIKVSLFNRLGGCVKHYVSWMSSEWGTCHLPMSVFFQIAYIFMQEICSSVLSALHCSWVALKGVRACLLCRERKLGPVILRSVPLLVNIVWCDGLGYLFANLHA